MAVLFVLLFVLLGLLSRCICWLPNTYISPLVSPRMHSLLYSFQPLDGGSIVLELDMLKKLYIMSHSRDIFRKDIHAKNDTAWRVK